MQYENMDEFHDAVKKGRYLANLPRLRDDLIEFYEVKNDPYKALVLFKKLSKLKDTNCPQEKVQFIFDGFNSLFHMVYDIDEATVGSALYESAAMLYTVNPSEELAKIMDTYRHTYYAKD